MPDPTQRLLRELADHEDFENWKGHADGIGRIYLRPPDGAITAANLENLRRSFAVKYAVAVYLHDPEPGVYLECIHDDDPALTTPPMKGSPPLVTNNRIADLQRDRLDYLYRELAHHDHFRSWRGFTEDGVVYLAPPTGTITPFDIDELLGDLQVVDVAVVHRMTPAPGIYLRCAPDPDIEHLITFVVRVLEPCADEADMDREIVACKVLASSHCSDAADALVTRDLAQHFVDTEYPAHAFAATHLEWAAVADDVVAPTVPAWIAEQKALLENAKKR